MEGRNPVTIQGFSSSVGYRNPKVVVQNVVMGFAVSASS